MSALDLTRPRRVVIRARQPFLLYRGPGETEAASAAPGRPRLPAWTNLLVQMGRPRPGHALPLRELRGQGGRGADAARRAPAQSARSEGVDRPTALSRG